MRVWCAIAAVIVIVLGTLAYSANGDPDDLNSGHINHDLIPPFRG
jgi:hypothetical protein